jgi:excisionase family DNA binding protein
LRRQLTKQLDLQIMIEHINLSTLPTWAKLEVTKEDLITFAQTLMAQQSHVSPSEPVKEIMTVEDAMLYLNLAKPTLYRMTANNELPFIKKSRKIYFNRSDLEKWLLEGKQKTRAELQAEATELNQSQKGKRSKR